MLLSSSMTRIFWLAPLMLLTATCYQHWQEVVPITVKELDSFRPHARRDQDRGAAKEPARGRGGRGRLTVAHRPWSKIYPSQVSVVRQARSRRRARRDVG